MQNQDFGSTQYFKVEKEPENGVKVILSAVYEALTEKGYNPVDQIVGSQHVGYVDGKGNKLFSVVGERKGSVDNFHTSPL